MFLNSKKLKSFVIKDCTTLIYLLPEWVRYKEEILKSFHFLLPEDQVKLVWDFIANNYLFIYLAIFIKTSKNTMYLSPRKRD